MKPGVYAALDFSSIMIIMWCLVFSLFSLQRKSKGQTTECQILIWSDWPPWIKSTTLFINLQCNEYQKITAQNTIITLKKITRRRSWFGSLTSSSTTRLYRGRVQTDVWNFTCCHTVTERGDHDFCLSRSTRRRRASAQNKESWTFLYFLSGVALID